MSTERKRPNRPVDGAPETAHPNDSEKYEKQIAGFTAKFLDICDSLEGNDEKAANTARIELQTLLMHGLGQSLRIARAKKKSVAKQWAGELLAIIGVSMQKHDKALCKANAKYAGMKKKLSGKSLTTALYPKGSVQRITQRELEKAEGYRKTLLLLKDGCISEREQKRRLSIKQKLPPDVELDLGKTWKQAARGKAIPLKYWTFIERPDFSMKSLSEWEKHLSPLVMKKIDVSKMQPLKPRAYDAVQVKYDARYDARTGPRKFIDTGMKNRKHYASDLGIHDTLELLARLKAAGIYY